MRKMNKGGWRAAAFDFCKRSQSKTMQKRILHLCRRTVPIYRKRFHLSLRSVRIGVEGGFNKDVLFRTEVNRSCPFLSSNVWYQDTESSLFSVSLFSFFFLLPFLIFPLSSIFLELLLSCITWFAYGLAFFSSWNSFHDLLQPTTLERRLNDLTHQTR